VRNRAILACLLLALARATGSAETARLKDAPPNTWVRVAESGPGPRTSFGLVYVPAEDVFVCFGGSMMMDPRTDPKAAASPYSEMTLNLDNGVWENRFPKGKEGVWGEPTGPSKAPGFPGSYYAFTVKDAEGNARPYLGAGYYNAMWNWGNYALDTDRGRAIVYWTLAHQTAEYDPLARTWELTAPAADIPQGFREGMLFGAMCYEPVNKESIGCQGEWAYAGGKWRKRVLGSALINGLRGKAEALRLRARNLPGACRARYYVAESDEEAKAGLDQVAAALVKDTVALPDETRAASAKAQAQERNQLEWAAEALSAAAAQLKKAGESLGAKVGPEAIHAADAARDGLRRAVLALSVQPPARAHARMAYDARNQKIVLFGGDALDRLLADTWVYDPATRSWEQRRPKLSPSPRSGYRMAYLPRSGKVLLIDGYGYKGNGETWIYDVRDNEWQLLAEGGAPRGAAPARDWYPVPGASNGEDVVVTFFRDGKAGLATYAARIDPARVDREGTAKLGVPPLTETPYPIAAEDPQWFENNAPPADPAAEEQWLKSLPANTWVMRLAPNWPKIEYGRSRCWGSCALDTDRGQLLHFGGGHGTYDGNDVLHYSIRANRCYIGHRPEHTLNFAPNGIGIPAATSYQGRPFMSCHTYKCYGYDPTLRKMVVCAQKDGDGLFIYDPRTGDWEAALATPFHKGGFDIKNYMTKCVSTPHGVVAWTRTGEGLWRVNAARMAWGKLPFQGKLEPPGWDTEGMAIRLHARPPAAPLRRAEGRPHGLGRQDRPDPSPRPRGEGTRRRLAEGGPLPARLRCGARRRAPCGQPRRQATLAPLRLREERLDGRAPARGGPARQGPLQRLAGPDARPQARPGVGHGPPLAPLCPAAGPQDGGRPAPGGKGYGLLAHDSSGWPMRREAA